MTDKEAMDKIQSLMDFATWDAYTFSEIAAAVRATGREVHELEPPAWPMPAWNGDVSSSRDDEDDDDFDITTPGMKIPVWED